MRFAYLTTDEVNQELAQALAEAHRITLCPLAPREAPPDDQFDAVLIDWDYWPADRRENALLELLASPVSRPVALHGYNVGPEWEEVLSQRGVAVHRTLQGEVFGSLRRAVLAARAAAACGRNQDDALATTERVGYSA